MSASSICHLLFFYLSPLRASIIFPFPYSTPSPSPRVVSSRLVASLLVAFRLAVSKLRHRFSHFCAAQRSIGYIGDDGSICCFVTTEPTIDARKGRITDAFKTIARPVIASISECVARSPFFVFAYVGTNIPGKTFAPALPS